MKQKLFILLILFCSACSQLHRGIPKHKANKDANNVEQKIIFNEDKETHLQKNNEFDILKPTTKEDENASIRINSTEVLDKKPEVYEISPIDTLFVDAPDTLEIDDHVLKKGKEHSNGIAFASAITVVGYFFFPALIVGILFGILKIILFNRLPYWEEETLRKKKKRTRAFFILITIPLVLILALVIFILFIF